MAKAQSCDMVGKIVTDAVILDLKMQQQKTYFKLLSAKEVAKPNNGLYDPSMMEVRNGKVTKSRSMVLLIVPALLKTGNSEGNEYRTRVIIEKAQVDIEIPKSKKGYF
jgi:hypothetical protein